MASERLHIEDSLTKGREELVGSLKEMEERTKETECKVEEGKLDLESQHQVNDEYRRVLALKNSELSEGKCELKAITQQVQTLTSSLESS